MAITLKNVKFFQISPCWMHSPSLKSAPYSQEQLPFRSSFQGHSPWNNWFYQIRCISVVINSFLFIWSLENVKKKITSISSMLKSLSSHPRLGSIQMQSVSFRQTPPSRMANFFHSSNSTTRLLNRIFLNFFLT